MYAKKDVAQVLYIIHLLIHVKMYFEFFFLEKHKVISWLCKRKFVFLLTHFGPEVEIRSTTLPIDGC